MNTQPTKHEITGMGIILTGLLLISAVPVHADHSIKGARCVNGVVVTSRTGAPGKEPNWIPQGMTCDPATYTAHGRNMAIKPDNRNRSAIPLQAGKPGYGYTVVN